MQASRVVRWFICTMFCRNDWEPELSLFSRIGKDLESGPALRCSLSKSASAQPSFAETRSSDHAGDCHCFSGLSPNTDSIRPQTHSSSLTALSLD